MVVLTVVAKLCLFRRVWGYKQSTKTDSAQRMERAQRKAPPCQRFRRANVLEGGASLAQSPGGLGNGNEASLILCPSGEPKMEHRMMEDGRPGGSTGQRCSGSASISSIGWGLGNENNSTGHSRRRPAEAKVCSYTLCPTLAHRPADDATVLKRKSMQE